MTASEIPEPVRGWQLRLEVDEPEARVATAVDDRGTIIGLAAAGSTRDGDAPTPWELYSINVVLAQRGSGVADELIRVTAGDKDASVWVLAENGRAQSFYHRHGFAIEGAAALDEVTGGRTLRMVRQLVGPGRRPSSDHWQ